MSEGPNQQSVGDARLRREVQMLKSGLADEYYASIRRERRPTAPVIHQKESHHVNH